MTLVTTSDTTNLNPGAVDQQTQENQGGLILGKFADQAALEAAYAELEAKIGQQQQQPTQEQQVQQVQQEQVADPSEQAATTALASAGIDFEALSTEYATDGKLSNASIEKLTKAGFPQDVINSYVEGAVARSEKIEAELYGPHGGFDAIQKALDWASTNLSDTDQAALNKQFESSDKATIKTGVDALMGRFKTANPPAPQLQMGGGNTGPAVKAFASQAEISKAVSDPRYGSDPAYTADYNKRLMATDFGSLR